MCRLIPHASKTTVALCLWLGARWAYHNVIFSDLCPNSSLTVTRFTPAITRWDGKGVALIVESEVFVGKRLCLKRGS